MVYALSQRQKMTEELDDEMQGHTACSGVPLVDVACTNRSCISMPGTVAKVLFPTDSPRNNQAGNRKFTVLWNLSRSFGPHHVSAPSLLATRFKRPQPPPPLTYQHGTMPRHLRDRSSVCLAPAAPSHLPLDLLRVADLSFPYALLLLLVRHPVI